MTGYNKPLLPKLNVNIEQGRQIEEHINKWEALVSRLQDDLYNQSIISFGLIQEQIDIVNKLKLQISELKGTNALVLSYDFSGAVFEKYRNGEWQGNDLDTVKKCLADAKQEIVDGHETNATIVFMGLPDCD